MTSAVALLRLGLWKEGLAELREVCRREPDNALFKAALEDAVSQAPVEFGGLGRPAKALTSGIRVLTSLATHPAGTF